jgi:hypothetical protein
MPLWASARVGRNLIVERTLAGLWLGCAANNQFRAGSKPYGLVYPKSAMMVFGLSGLNLLSNKSPSHSRNHMLVAGAVARAHWQKREFKCTIKKSPAEAGTSVQVSKIGNDHLPEDATAWPRLLRARDRVCAQSASSSSSTPPTPSPTLHIIPIIPIRVLGPQAKPPHPTNSHVNRPSHSSECHVLYCILMRANTL